MKQYPNLQQINGFFQHPSSSRYGASPDALGPGGLLVEIKTRAVNADGPLKSLASFPNYFVQCQLQMVCTDAHSCILLSYHPESKHGNFFLIKRDDLLMNVIKDICDCLLNNELLLEWYHNEVHELKLLGKKLTGKKMDFEILKPLRSYINKCTKKVSPVKFIDEIEFEI